jgi:hypothetical protein
MMKAARTSETSVDNYFTRQYIPEDKSELHTTTSGFCGNVTVFLLFVLYSKVHSLVTIVTSAKGCMWCNHGNPIMLHKKSKLTVKQGSPHNLNHFKMVEAVELTIIVLRSPWILSPAYQISWKSTKQFKVISGGHTDRQMMWYAYFHSWKVGWKHLAHTTTQRNLKW